MLYHHVFLVLAYLLMCEQISAWLNMSVSIFTKYVMSDIFFTIYFMSE